MPRSLRKNRHSAKVSFELVETTTGSKAVCRVDMFGNQHAEIVDEIADTVGRDVIRFAGVAGARTFAGITLENGYVASSDGGGPVAGARAVVDTAGELSRRMTVTRILLTGPLAFGWRKKQDHREVYLLVEGRGWAISAEVPPNLGAEARRCAARVNAAAGSENPTAEPADDPTEQIRKLGELRDSGLLTTAEFEAKKADLLKRV